MRTFYKTERVKVIEGDCLEVLRKLPDNSIHAVITDPPYGLSNTDPKHVADTIVKWASGEREYAPTGKGFMGASWDAFVPPPAVWDECLRVLKPGGHLLCFAGTRTQDLMGLSIRLAGFDIRENLAWLYGSGFPKSHNISKAIDKMGGDPKGLVSMAGSLRAAREARGITVREADELFCGGSSAWAFYEGRLLRGETSIVLPSAARAAQIVAAWPETQQAFDLLRQSGALLSTADVSYGYREGERWTGVREDKAPGTAAAKQWEGWGTALKPAFEPIIMAQKPFKGTVANNVLTHGVGGLNIDATRIATTDNLNGGAYAEVGGREESASLHGGSGMNVPGKTADAEYVQPAGRWPANVILGHLPECEEAGQVTERVGGGAKATSGFVDGYDRGDGFVGREVTATVWRCVDGCPVKDLDAQGDGASRFFYVAKANKKERPGYETEDGERVVHSTVKPLTLMRYLVRLVTPENGIVLDPFSGSGTTAEATFLEGFSSLAIEAEPTYLPLIQQRIERNT